MHIEYEELHAFKCLNLPEILISCGISLKSKGQEAYLGLCPFHDDENPSLSLTKRSDGVWLWHCFACRIGGTTIDFVMKKENLSLQDTYKKLRQMLPHTNGNGNGVHKPNVFVLLKNVAEFYHKTFFEDKRGLEYLRGRGIKSEEIVRSFKIGFVNGSMRKNLSYTSPLMKDLKEIGILNEEGNEFFYNSIVIPLLDQDGNVVSFYGRNISQKRHLYLKGPHKGLVNRQGAFDADKVILTEAVLDALSLYELGVRNVIPCYGTGGFTEDHKQLLLKQKIKEVELCFDNDDAGRGGAGDLAAKLGSLGIKCSRINLPEGIKDPNDLLVSKKTKEEFSALERVTIEIPQTLFDMETSYQIQKEKGVFHLKAKSRSYRILLPEYDSIHSLRVNLKLTLGEVSHVDIVDLYSQRQRKSYAKRIEQKFSLPESEIEKDLGHLLEELEKLRDEAKEEAQEKAYEMSEEEKQTALKALKNPKLIQEILQDLERIGCIGEESNKLLGYITTLSRKLESPLSLIIVSQSGAGKSNLADTLGSVVPPSDCIHLSRITPQALYYMDKDALKGKVLIIEEKEGSRDADYSIRVLQSRKVLSLAVPMKDPQTGKMKTTTFEVQGPLVVIETTTKSDHNPENTSRCFILYLNETEEQTKKIHHYQKSQRTLEGQSQKKEKEKILKKHQAIQCLMRPLGIVIPYVHDIHFPTKWIRARRDHEKFLNLLQAVCFLHQYQREVKKTREGSEYIEATPEDYGVTYSLIQDVLGDSLSELPKPSREFFESLKTMSKSLGRKNLRRREIRDLTGLPDHVVRQHLEILVQMEYLVILEGKQGKTYEYQINEEPLVKREIIQGLTTPEELGKNFERTSRKL